MRSYPIKPTPFVHVTQAMIRMPRSKLAETEKGRAWLRYLAFRDEVRLRRVRYEIGDRVCFVLPMPKSWSKRKRAEMCGQPHRQIPDKTSLIRALEDALKGQCSSWQDDREIWVSERTIKVWGETGAIQIWRDDG